MFSVPFTHSPFSWREGNVWVRGKNYGAKDEDLFSALSNKEEKKQRLLLLMRNIPIYTDSISYHWLSKFIYWIYISNLRLPIFSAHLQVTRGSHIRVCPAIWCSWKEMSPELKLKLPGFYTFSMAAKLLGSQQKAIPLSLPISVEDLWEYPLKFKMCIPLV